ncbi:hypothetical protein LRS13_02770 [Svornostia abyssi]|uniref:ABM domain-containing protein n=1 Tax=Svornostia abyssi TaxID=2898438 RepID=A0ABY5PJ82_9ACTN|nr:hypothetical protein LRS13_02770 [Parviterribacteraceae bacterium J379]
MFMAIAVHHVVPEHRDAMIAFMNGVGETTGTPPGLIEFDGWQESGGKLIGMSKWESPEAFHAALPVIMSTSDQRRDEWCSQPDDVYTFTQL